MFALLPKAIQKEVLHYLEKNDFTQAKKIYDNWFIQHSSTLSSTSNRSSKRETLRDSLLIKA